MVEKATNMKRNVQSGLYLLFTTFFFFFFFYTFFFFFWSINLTSRVALHSFPSPSHFNAFSPHTVIQKSTRCVLLLITCCNAMSRAATPTISHWSCKRLF